jgi:hypothetical protein
VAVPSNGSLNMSGLAKEKLFDDYNSSSTPIGPIYMSDLVTGGNSSGSAQTYDFTNPNSGLFPDNLTPHAFSEWYGYNHDSWFERFYPEIYTGNEDLNQSPSIDPLVLDATGDDFFDQLRWRYFDIELPSEWQGLYIRPKVLFFQSNQDFRNDVAISTQWVWLTEDKSGYSQAFNQDGYSGVGFTGNNFGQRESGATALPADDPNIERVWEDIPSAVTNTNNKWCIETIETPSNGTGPAEDPMYMSDPINSPSSPNYRGVRWYQIGEETSNRAPYFYYESSGAYSVPQHKWFRYKDAVQVPQGVRYLSFAYSAWSEDGAIDFINDYLKVFLEVEDFGITPPPTFG